MPKVKIRDIKIDISSYIIDEIGLKSMGMFVNINKGKTIEFVLYYPEAKRVDVEKDGKRIKIKVRK